jgi:DNA-binding XRE family transcriptional regulator
LDVKEAFLAFKDKRIDESQFAAFIFPTLKRLAKIVGYRQGVDTEDLASELWILTRARLVETFDPKLSQGGIETFLMGCARRISSTNGIRNLRPPQEEMCVSDIQFDGWNNNDTDSVSSQEFIENVPDPHSESALSDVYRQRMLDEIQLRLCDNKKKIGLSTKYIGDQANKEPKNMKKSAVPGVKLVPTKERPNNALPMPPKRPPKAATLSMDQEELVNIRHQLSYSQELFAKALGIGVPCLASYEYGRTSGVPENIMETAKRLLHEVGCTDAKKYEGVPMSEILAKWAEQLDIPYENDVALSKALTVSTATISRWKNNKTRPPLIGKPGRIGEPGKLGLKQLQELVRKFRDK